MTTEFTIASHVPDCTEPLMNDVNNLCYRLKLQQDNILKTETQIEDLLRRIMSKKGFDNDFVEKIIELLSWTISDSRCRKTEIYREVGLYLSTLPSDVDMNPAEVATIIRKKIR